MSVIWLALVGHLAWGATVMTQDVALDSTAAITEDSSEPFAGRALEPYADLRSWIERVENRPGTTEDLERARATLRAGLRWRPMGSPAEVVAGARLSLGSDRNDEARAAFDNLAPDTIEVDELAGRMQSVEGSSATLGKMRSPLALTEMTWDLDLRPVGIAAALSLDKLGVQGTRLTGGWLQRADWTDDAWMAAGQASIAGESGATQAEMVASYLEFGRLEDLPNQGFGRQNTTVPSPEGRQYAVEFRIVDLQLSATTRWGRVPMAARIDVARNVAASEHRDAIRTRLALGGVETPAGLEIGWLYQRIERDAVCGAFNSDDWWFHSRMRGHLGWIAWGLGRPIGLKLSGTIEQRDDLTTEVHRLRAELIARPPSR